MTIDNKRVLVLDNIEIQLEIATLRIEREGYEVVPVQSLNQALQEIDEKLFSVCVVDLMLEDPDRYDTFEGINLVAAADELDEGTRCLLYTGNPSQAKASELTRKFGVFDYIERSASTPTTLLPDAVNRAHAAATLDISMDIDRLSAQMFGRAGNDTAMVQTNVKSALKHRPGLEALKKTFGFVFTDLLPLWGKEPSPYGWEIDRREQTVRKNSWSKGLGRPVEIVISGGVIESQHNELVRETRRGLTYVAIEGPAADRSLFSGRLSQEFRDSSN